MKNILKGLIAKLYMALAGISEFEDTSTEIPQTEMQTNKQTKKKMEKLNRMSKNCGGQLQRR